MVKVVFKGITSSIAIPLTNSLFEYLCVSQVTWNGPLAALSPYINLRYKYSRFPRKNIALSNSNTCANLTTNLLSFCRDTLQEYSNSVRIINFELYESRILHLSVISSWT